MAEQKKTNEALNVEDALTQSEAFLIKNKKTIIGAILAIIIIIAGIVMYKNLYAAPREEKAQAALFKGQEYFEADAFEEALNGDSIGYVGFIKIADQYSGTDAANLAKAYAGLCYAHLGKFDEAVKALENFDGDDQMVALQFESLARKHPGREVQCMPGIPHQELRRPLHRQAESGRIPQKHRRNKGNTQGKYPGDRADAVSADAGACGGNEV